MKLPEDLPEDFLKGMNRCSIDASSIIYMLKTGILGYVSAEISLVASKEVIEEVGWPRLPVDAVQVDQEMTNDDTVLYLAEKNEIPLISEDLEILQEARDRKIPFYNTLMILNFLLLKGRIAPGDYPEYFERLVEISHYSDEVIGYGKEIERIIRERFF